MFVDAYGTGWLDAVRQRDAGLPPGARLVCVIDGVFLPGVYRAYRAALAVDNQPVLLFEGTPSCSDETRDVSPFVFRFEPGNARLAELLARCSGMPMLSMVATYETAAVIGARLGAWCVVEAGDQRFNFRFPDTRRLPAIFRTLTPEQRGQMLGRSIAWHYIDRAGRWQELVCETSDEALEIADRPTLSDAQFGLLVDDSAADEMWVRVEDRVGQVSHLPSERHALLSKALRVAAVATVDEVTRMQWCADCLGSGLVLEDGAMTARFVEWREAKARQLA